MNPARDPHYMVTHINRLTNLTKVEGVIMHPVHKLKFVHKAISMSPLTYKTVLLLY